MKADDVRRFVNSSTMRTFHLKNGRVINGSIEEAGNEVFTITPATERPNAIETSLGLDISADDIASIT